MELNKTKDIAESLDMGLTPCIIIFQHTSNIKHNYRNRKL